MGKGDRETDRQIQQDTGRHAERERDGIWELHLLKLVGTK